MPLYLNLNQKKQSVETKIITKSINSYEGCPETPKNPYWLAMRQKRLKRRSYERGTEKYNGECDVISKPKGNKG